MCYPLLVLKFVQNFKKSGRLNDPKIGSKSQKAWILGVFRPILRSATAVYSCRTAGKKYLCFSNILSFLHGFYAVLHTTTRLSCIYSLLTTFSADPKYLLYYPRERSVYYTNRGGEWRGCIAATPHFYMVRSSVKASTIGASK